MKKVMLTAVCMSVLLGGALCADAKDNEHKFDKRPPIEMVKHQEKLAEKLKLSEEQKEKADEIRRDGRKKMKPLMEQKKELHEKMDKLRKENMQEFEKILTDEQKEEFKKMRKHREEKFKKHHKQFREKDDELKD